MYVSQLKAVLIHCPNQSLCTPWATECKSIICIIVDATSICQQIEFLTADNTEYRYSRFDKQDVRFMYSQLIKYVLTEMVYSNDDTNNMIEFFENKYYNFTLTAKC